MVYEFLLPWMIIYLSVINVYLQRLLLRDNLKLDLRGPRKYMFKSKVCRMVSLN